MNITVALVFDWVVGDPHDVRFVPYKRCLEQMWLSSDYWELAF